MPRKRAKQRRYEPLDVLAYIATYRERNAERSPSERQLQQELGISSSSMAHTILIRLEHAGLLAITRYGRGHRSDLVLTAAGRTAVQVWQEGQGPADDSPSVERE